jgi:uncharacterized protein (DUF58 family)
VYFWIFLIASSYIIARVGFDSIDVRRRTRVERSEVGHIFEEVFEVRNRSRLPRLWIEIRDRSDLPGSDGSRVLTLLGGGRVRNYVSRTRLISRGVFSLGPTELRSGDLFGLFSISRSIQSKKLLIVYPRLVNFIDVPNPPGLLPGGEAVRRRTPQITPNAATVREYSVGDPMTRIHWPSVARRNRLIVKEFELDPLAQIWIFVDGQSAAHARLDYVLETDAGSVIFQRAAAGKLIPNTAEYCATLAASLAKHYLQAGRTVGFTSAGSELILLPAERGNRQLNKIIEATALFRADGSDGFSDFVSRQSRHLPRGSTLYLVTPSVDERIITLGDQLRRLGQRTIVLLIDAATFGGRAGSQELAAKLKVFGVPYALIQEGQPLNDVVAGTKAAYRKMVFN